MCLAFALYTVASALKKFLSLSLVNISGGSIITSKIHVPKCALHNYAAAVEKNLLINPFLYMKTVWHLQHAEYY